jgi:hypothetical protein
MVDLRPYLAPAQTPAPTTVRLPWLKSIPTPGNEGLVPPAWLRASDNENETTTPKPPFVHAPWAKLQRLGLALFPVAPGRKTPEGALAPSGCKNASRDPATLARWSADQSLNIGVATGECSGIFVLDIDTLDALADADRRGLPDTLTVRTPRGKHYYFRLPGWPVRNRTGIFPGADVRGEGGYVLGAGSSFAPTDIERAEGKQAGRYCFDGPSDQQQITDAPAWLLDLLEAGRGNKRASGEKDTRSRAWAANALKAEVGDLRSACPGERNAALNQAAFNLGQIAGGGHLQAQPVLDELRATASAIGLKAEEIERTLASGWAAGLKTPRNPPEQAARSGRGATVPGADTTFRPFDIGVTASNRAPPPVCPLTVIPDPWSGWLADEAKQAGAPVDYTVMSLLTVAAAAVGNARRVSPWAGWVEPSILWAMIVGDPSAGKTPGLRPPLALVQPLDAERAEAFGEAMACWRERDMVAKVAHEVWERTARALMNKGLKPPPVPPEALRPIKPVCPALILNDSTPEMLALLARAMPKGLLFFRDELAGWFNDFGRYGGDGERQLWLEAYNGASRRIDRVKHDEPLTIPRFSVGVLGGIQPERFTEAIVGEADDGLAARFLYAFPDPVPPKRPTPRLPALWPERAIRRLSELEMRGNGNAAEPIVLDLSPDAADALQDWRERHADETRAVQGLAKGAWGKMPGQALRLALTLTLLGWSAVEGLPEPSIVDAATLQNALTLIDAYFKPMALRAFGDAAMPADLTATAMLARWIVANRPKSFNARKVRHGTACPAFLRDASKMESACRGLVDAGWLVHEGKRDDGKPGRQSLDFRVNPAVQDFEAEATFGTL